MRFRAALAGLAALLSLALPAVAPAADSAARKDLRWAVYYASDAPVEAFAPYDILVLDAEYHPPLQPLRARGKTLFGYLSLGEAGQHQAHFEVLKREGLLVRESAVWKGSWAIDIRDPRWTRRVIEELIPDILRQGFDGLFIDTLDSSLALETGDSKAWSGMAEAAIALVRTIKRHYPHVQVMLNRAYPLLPELAGDIDIVLGESVYARHDARTKTYALVPEGEYLAQVDLLKGARKRNPDLRVFTLDYWRTDDADMIRKIYALQRKNGFHPYVSTVKLNHVIPEPGS